MGACVRKSQLLTPRAPLGQDTDVSLYNPLLHKTQFWTTQPHLYPESQSDSWILDPLSVLQLQHLCRTMLPCRIHSLQDSSTHCPWSNCQLYWIKFPAGYVCHDYNWYISPATTKKGTLKNNVYSVNKLRHACKFWRKGGEKKWQILSAMRFLQNKFELCFQNPFAFLASVLCVRTQLWTDKLHSKGQDFGKKWSFIPERIQHQMKEFADPICLWLGSGVMHRHSTATHCNPPPECFRFPMYLCTRTA